MTHSRPHPPAGRRRAMVLIVSLGALTLLAVLASTFAMLTAVERDTAGNYVLEVRAMMLAHSGIEYAIARLRTAKPPRVPVRFFGEDWNAGGETTGADADADDLHGNRDGFVQFGEGELRYARRPSFFVDADGDDLPDLTPVLEAGGIRLRGFSGRMPGTLHVEGDTFVLRVEESSGYVSINQKGDGYRNLYDNLGMLAATAVAGGGPGAGGRGGGRGAGGVAGAAPVAGLGARIQASQPYETIDELVTRGVLTAAEFALLRPYLCVHAWVDPTTIKPDPQPDVYSRPEALRRTDHLEPRAPINVNVADPVVLKACLQGVAGYNTERIVPRKSVLVLDPAVVEELVDALVLARDETFVDTDGNGEWDPSEAFVDLYPNGRYDGPFRGWQQFEDFVDGLPSFSKGGRGRPDGKSRWARDLILANADPNTMLNVLQPDHQLQRAIDKSDLIRYTTEFCFEWTGTFLVRSLGRVTDPRFEVQAEREIECTFRLFEIARLTTQLDFETARVAAETGPDVVTLPEEVAAIRSEAWQDTNMDRHFGPGDSFLDEDGDGAFDGPAIYDGQVVLRPADPPELGPWGDAAANLAFRCLFNDSPGCGGLGPDVYPSLTGDTASPTADRGVPLQTPPYVSSVECGGSLIEDLSGSNDYPDVGPTGLFVRQEIGEALYWSSILNWPVGQGSVLFWLRPTWDTRPQANQSKDLLALNQQFQIEPNKGRIARLYSVHFGLTPSLFFMDSETYGSSQGTIADEVADDGGTDSPWKHTRYQMNLDWDWTPDQWHDFALIYTDQIRWECFLDGEPFRVVTESQQADLPDTQLGWVKTTGNLISLSSYQPWKDTQGSGTYDDFRVFRTRVPSTAVGLAPAWRYDDTGVPGWSEYVGLIRLPVGARVRSIGWTERRPNVNYRGEPLSSSAALTRQRRPDVHLSYRVAPETVYRPAPRPRDPDGPDGGQFPVARGTSSVGGAGVYVKLTFDRAGQEPFRNSPAVDDVTVTWVTGAGVSILTWRVLP